MKLIVIVPLIITIESPAKEKSELYGADRTLRRQELLDLALNKIPSGPEVEVPEADNEGVIFLDQNEEELPEFLGQRRR
jgi:hypothetical protein